MRIPAKTFSALILLCSCAALAQAQAVLAPPPKRDYKYDGKIVSTYDREKGRTVVLIQLMPVKDVEDPRPIWEDTPDKPRSHDRLSFTAFFAYPGETPSTPKYVSIGFTYLALDPQRYEEKEHLLTAKIDKERVELGKMEVLHTEQVVVRTAYKRYTRRVLELAIPYEQFLRIANAKKVKLKIGDMEFELSKDHMEAVRDLASRTAP